MDAQWRWLHARAADGFGGAQPCLNGLRWNKDICSDAATCARQCALEGLDVKGYELGGVVVRGDSVELSFVSPSGSTGSRLYLTEHEDAYKMFRLKNRELSFDVDVSELPCGLSGALYFVEMDRHGGVGEGNNRAGAKLGTGYCDAQCDRSLKFVGGAANLDWRYGACCAQLDVWEANRAAHRIAARPCAAEGPTLCEGALCGSDRLVGAGICAQHGCSVGSLRAGNESFFGAGPGFALDSTRQFKVVTQFKTADGTDSGELFEIQQFYVQDGRIVPDGHLAGTSAPPSPTGRGPTTMSEAACGAAASAGAWVPDDFESRGGLRGLGEAMDRGMVLALSLNFVDASLDATASRWGDDRQGPMPLGPGACPPESRERITLESPWAKVRFANIRHGALGSTFRPVESTAPGLLQEGKFSELPPREADPAAVQLSPADRDASTSDSNSLRLRKLVRKVAFLSIGMLGSGVVAAMRWHAWSFAVETDHHRPRRLPLLTSGVMRPLAVHEPIELMDKL